MPIVANTVQKTSYISGVLEGVAIFIIADSTNHEGVVRPTQSFIDAVYKDRSVRTEKGREYRFNCETLRGTLAPSLRLVSSQQPSTAKPFASCYS